MDRQNNIFLLLESMDIEPMWYHDTIQGIENEAHRKKLVVKKLFDFERIPATCKVLVIIGHSKDWFNDIIYRSRNKGIRIILVGSNPELYGEDISGSIYGVKTTVKTLLQFLSEKGANKIALVDIDKTNSIDSMKKSGFIEGCNELGLKSNESDIFEKDSEHDLDVFFRNINQYDGVIASNDACGAFILSVTKKYLINVPKDFFVCAIGDHLISKYTIPSLTSANRSYVDAGVRAVLTWKELMTSDNLLSIIQKEKTVINERQSTLGRKNGNISCSIIISRNECINGIQKMRRIQYCLSMCDYMDLKIIELILKNESNERISDLVFASSSTVAYRLKKIYENAGVEGKSQFQSLFGDEINIEEMKKKWLMHLVFLYNSNNQRKKSNNNLNFRFYFFSLYFVQREKGVYKMKRILFVMVLCLALSMLFANGSAENAKAETIKIVLADINNAESIPGKTSQALADMINAESNGRIVVETYLGGQLGNEADTISNLRSGVVGITKINVANLETRGIAVPEYTLFGLPYLFRSKQHAEKYFYSEKGAELAAKIGEATNGEIYGLNGYLIAAPRSFFFKSEVHSMAEAAGKKVRSESTPMKIDMMTAFGMSATPLGLNDMYSGLQTGMIDGGEHNVSTIKSYAFYEQCPYVLLTRNNYNANIFLISGVLKDQLSDEDLALINECVKKVSIEYSKLFEEDDAKTMAELEAKGVKFIEPTDPEAWQNAALSLYEKYAVGYDDFISEVLSYDN